MFIQNLLAPMGVSLMTLFGPVLLLTLGTVPLSLAQECPPASPYSDTPASLARAKCEAPKVICCTCGGTPTTSSSSSTSRATSPSSTAGSSSSSPPSSASPSSVAYSSSSSSEASSSTASYGSSSPPSDNSSSSSSSSPPEASSTSSRTSLVYESSTAGTCTCSCSGSSSSAASEASSAPPLSSSSSDESSSSSSSTSDGSEGSSASPPASSSSPPTSPSGGNDSSSAAPSSPSSPSSPASSSAVSSDASSSPPAQSSTASSSSSASTTSPSSGGHEPCPCQLIIALIEFMKKFLNASEQNIFELECLAKLRVILVDVSLSVEQKIVKCGYVLRSFCAAYPSIGDRCKWVSIGDYGYVYDFAFVVAIAYEDEMAGSVCNRINNGGDNNLTEAISRGTSQDQCGSGSASVWAGFVGKARQVNARTIPRMSRARQLAWYSKSFKAIYFGQYPAHEQCVRNISIQAGDYSGNVDQFLGLCNWYDVQSELVQSVLKDSSSSGGGECPFVESLQAGCERANSSGQANSSVVEEAFRFVANCRQQFQSTQDGGQRLQIVLQLFPSLSAACRLLLKPIQIVGAFASCICADVISVGNSCANGFACQNVSYGGPGESLDETCLADSFNISTLVQASLNYLNSQTGSARLQYRSFHNSISNCCYSAQYGSNLTARVECAKTYVRNYSANNAAVRAVYLTVELATVIITKVTSNVISAFYGTLGCFCGCGSC